MRATLKSVIGGQDSVYPLECETIDQMHEHAQRACRAGLLGAMAFMMIAADQPFSVSLEKAYEGDGQYVPYTLEFEGNLPDEHGLVDISVPALAAHHMSVLKTKPELQKVLSSHVDCPKDEECRVRQLYDALGIPFPPAFD